MDVSSLVKIHLLQRTIEFRSIDIYLRSGTHYLKPNLPVILGKEISGIVEEVDEDVSTFKVMRDEVII